MKRRKDSKSKQIMKHEYTILLNKYVTLQKKYDTALYMVEQVTMERNRLLFEKLNRK